MSIGFTGEALVKLPIVQRKALILEQASLIDATHITNNDLYNAYKLGKAISSIAKEYFQYQIEQDNQSNSVLQLEQQSELIRVLTDEFATNFIKWLVKYFEQSKTIIESHPNPTNLFQLSGATLLANSNSITRTLSTRMGSLWEKISNISPYFIVPDFEFGLKITGVDIILFTNNTIKFAQLKTLKGTLTGSQAPRAKNELSIHDETLFIAAFDLGSWTFPAISKTPRVAGKTFWEMICIDYSLIETHVKNMLQRIDKAFAELAAS